MTRPTGPWTLPTAISVWREEREQNEDTVRAPSHYHWRRTPHNLSRSSASLRSDHDAVVPVITMAWTD